MFSVFISCHSQIYGRVIKNKQIWRKQCNYFREENNKVDVVVSWQLITVILIIENYDCGAVAEQSTGGGLVICELVICELIVRTADANLGYNANQKLRTFYAVKIDPYCCCCCCCFLLYLSRNNNILRSSLGKSCNYCFCQGYSGS